MSPQKNSLKVCYLGNSVKIISPQKNSFKIVSPQKMRPTNNPTSSICHSHGRKFSRRMISLFSCRGLHANFMQENEWMMIIVGNIGSRDSRGIYSWNIFSYLFQLLFSARFSSFDVDVLVRENRLKYTQRYIVEMKEFYFSYIKYC